MDRGQPGRSVGRRFFGLSAQKWMKKEEVSLLLWLICMFMTSLLNILSGP